MMLSVRIENPVRIRNRTIGEHLAMIDWTDDEVSKAVEVKIDESGETEGPYSQPFIFFLTYEWT
jgi:hypothetical protein